MQAADSNSRVLNGKDAIKQQLLDLNSPISAAIFGVQSQPIQISQQPPQQGPGAQQQQQQGSQKGAQQQLQLSSQILTEQDRQLQLQIEEIKQNLQKLESTDVDANEMDEDEKLFLEYMNKVEEIRNKSLEELKKEYQMQQHSTRMTAKTRNQQNSSLEKKKQKEFDGMVIFRMDYFNKMNTNYQQVQIFYGLMNKNDRPNPEYKSKYYIVENSQVKIYAKETFKKVQPNKDLYLYIEMHGYTKTQADIAKHWTIFPLFNDNLQLNSGIYKLNFYDVVYSTHLLFQKSLPYVSPTQICIKICATKEKELDSDKMMSFNEYVVPDIHSHEKRAKTEAQIKELQ